VGISGPSSPINSVNSIFRDSLGSGKALEGPVKNPSFAEIINQKLEEANALQKEADRLTEDFILGKPVEIHQMLIAAEKAELALRQTVAVRDKLIEAYKQIANMQI